MANDQIKDEVDELASFWDKHRHIGLHFKNLRTFPLQQRNMRGTKGAWFDLAGNRTIEAHVSEIPPGGNNKKHRHMNEAIIFILVGRGYSIIQEEGQEPMKIEWEEGDMLSPPLNAWHQHFNSDPEKPARYLAFTNIALMVKLGAFTKDQAPGQD